MRYVITLSIPNLLNDHSVVNFFSITHNTVLHIVWKSFCDKLQKLQNWAARILTFANFDTNTDKLFQELDWRNYILKENSKRL